MMADLNSLDYSTTVRDLLFLSGIQKILDMKGITEIAINEPLTAWFDRGNGWESQALPELNFNLCFSLAKALCVFAGLREPLSSANPIAPVIFPDGERGQVCVPPATLNNIVSFTIRKPSTSRFTLDDYERTGRFSECDNVDSSDFSLSKVQRELLDLKDKKKFSEFFELAVKSNLNILIVGGTGSGKTTVMKAMVDNYPKEKRIFTIEDVHELDLPMHPNHVHLFYKQGGLTPKRIIESSMRMKPDHILLAELRGDEAWSYLEMLNTGHDGSITTIHANDCRGGISRLASLIKQSEVGQTLEVNYILETVRKSIDVIAFFKYTNLIEIYYEPQIKNNLMGGIE